MDKKNIYKNLTILMIEDNPDDIVLAQEAFELSNFSGTLRIVEEGEDALEYIFQKGKYADAARPDLILMDWKLPRFSGKEILKHIKTDENLKAIPIIVLSTSKDNNDIIDMYKGYANCYITKTMDIKHFIIVIERLLDFWFNTATLPE